MSHSIEHREYLRNKMIAQNTKHGYAKRSERLPEYWIWKRMRQRCNDPLTKQWHQYGGRGIKVDPRWFYFENFLHDMGHRPSPKHSIERINNNLGYSPSNCKWATVYEQARNKRNNHLVTCDDKTLTVADWSELSLISQSRIIWRLKKGWSPRDAIFTPAKRGRNQYG